MNCSTPHKSCAALGIGAGLFTAMASALYTVFARMGLHEGLTPYDITFLRYCVAAGAGLGGGEAPAAGGQVLADEAGEGVELGVGGGVHQPVSRRRIASTSRV